MKRFLKLLLKLKNLLLRAVMINIACYNVYVEVIFTIKNKEMYFYE